MHFVLPYKLHKHLIQLRLNTALFSRRIMLPLNEVIKSFVLVFYFSSSSDCYRGLANRSSRTEWTTSCRSSGSVTRAPPYPSGCSAAPSTRSTSCSPSCCSGWSPSCRRRGDRIRRDRRQMSTTPTSDSDTRLRTTPSSDKNKSFVYTAIEWKI